MVKINVKVNGKPCTTLQTQVIEHRGRRSNLKHLTPEQILEHREANRLKNIEKLKTRYKQVSLLEEDFNEFKLLQKTIGSGCEIFKSINDILRASIIGVLGKKRLNYNIDCSIETTLDNQKEAYNDTNQKGST